MPPVSIPLMPLNFLIRSRPKTAAVFLLLGIFFSAANLRASDDLMVFSDQRNNGWADWSWVPRYNTTAPVHSGTNPISGSQQFWRAQWLP